MLDETGPRSGFCQDCENDCDRPRQVLTSARILDALASHIAILDVTGRILYTNRAWQDFARSSGVTGDPSMIGVNYLSICSRAEGADAEIAQRSSVGIRAVAQGDEEVFLIDYPCHSPTERRWFHLRATRFFEKGTPFIIVSHDNVTDLKLIQERLEINEQQLERRAADLEEANTALKVLLRQREQDQREMEKDILINVRKRVLPYVERLRRSRVDEQQLKMIGWIESSLQELTSPFLRTMSRAESRLTPREIQVAQLVRDGHSSKEIAVFLDLSTRAVEFHRANIRKKFALKERRQGLRSFLLSLDR